jgi:hypothetical protein
MHLVLLWQLKFMIEMSKSLVTNASLCSGRESYFLHIFATFSQCDPLQIWRCIWLWKLDSFLDGDNQRALSSQYVFLANYKQISSQPQYSLLPRGKRGFWSTLAKSIPNRQLRSPAHFRSPYPQRTMFPDSWSLLYNRFFSNSVHMS